jgi:hypothetical protein
MRISRLSVTTLVVLAIAIVLGLVAIAGAGASVNPPPRAAIQPLTNLAHVQDVSNGGPGGPGIARTQQGIRAFTSVDVTHYITTHPFPLGPTTTGKPPTIVSIEFITSKQASQRLLGESIGVPDTAIVCYVKLSGPFTMSFAPHPPGAQVPPSNTATEIFDAQTGNLLLVRSN